MFVAGVNMKLAANLLVLRCTDVEITWRFYEQLGLAFVEEKHGNGPQHYAWENSGFVLELYPAAEAFQSGRRDAALPDAHAMADRLVQAQADPDGLVPAAPEIVTAGPRASHWP